jgi:hypothetical protein
MSVGARISIYIILPSALFLELRNEYQESSLRVKCGRRVRTIYDCIV